LTPSLEKWSPRGDYALLYPSLVLSVAFSELKKREKNREREAKKAASTAAKPTPPTAAKAAAAGPNEDELTPNVSSLLSYTIQILSLCSNTTSFVRATF